MPELVQLAQQKSFVCVWSLHKYFFQHALHRFDLVNEVLGLRTRLVNQVEVHYLPVFFGKGSYDVTLKVVSQGLTHWLVVFDLGFLPGAEEYVEF
jgi:hypothetical protein